MDEIDRNLLAAWGRVSGRCRRDRVEAAKRARRRLGTTMNRPPRAWCLALRAGDRRISSWNAAIVPEDGPANHQAHEVTLDGRAIRDLCAPVWLDWPGLRVTEAAAKLGRDYKTVTDWLRDGVLRVRYDKAQCHGHFGKAVPVVWSPRALDPGASKCASPHPVWGSLWQYLCQRIPDAYELVVRREPRLMPQGRGGDIRFRGWFWVCPGRWHPADPGGAPMFCGRRCRTLYAPLPPYTIAHFLGQEQGFDVEAHLAPGKPPGAQYELHLAGRWYPGLDDPLAGWRSFACDHCWGVKHFSLTDHRGWNEFVAHLSGGLLFGREVARPAWVRYHRKRPHTARRRKAKRSASAARSVKAV